MINQDGYIDWAIKTPGPQDRLTFYNQNTLMDLICFHSQAGYYDTYKVQEEPSRYPTMPHGHNLLNGTLMQHAPVQSATVHGNYANLRGPGWEAEGVRSIDGPITGAQLGTAKRIIKEIALLTTRMPKRWTGVYPNFPPSIDGVLWLVEHNQMGRTECPDSRYEPLWKLYEEEVTKEELAELLFEQEHDLIASWGAAGEQSLPWEQRVSTARYRRDKAVAGVDDSTNPDGSPRAFHPLYARIDEYTAARGD